MQPLKRVNSYTSSLHQDSCVQQSFWLYTATTSMTQNCWTPIYSDNFIRIVPGDDPWRCPAIAGVETEKTWITFLRRTITESPTPFCMSKLYCSQQDKTRDMKIYLKIVYLLTLLRYENYMESLNKNFCVHGLQRFLIIAQISASSGCAKRATFFKTGLHANDCSPISKKRRAMAMNHRRELTAISNPPTSRPPALS